MKAIKYLSILAASTLILASCTKQVAGATGPNGLQGPQGATSSYITYIDSVSTTGGSGHVWAGPTANNGGNLYTFQIPVNGLTSPNSSIVEVYYATSDISKSSTWYELEYSPGATPGDVLSFYYTTYSVTVTYFNPTGTGTPPGWSYFKVVIITVPQ